MFLHTDISLNLSGDQQSADLGLLTVTGIQSGLALSCSADYLNAHLIVNMWSRTVMVEASFSLWRAKRLVLIMMEQSERN